MNVVHISKYPDGGASWCAMRISNALRTKGVDSRILLMQGMPSEKVAVAEPDRLYRWYGNTIQRIVMKLLKVFVRPSFEYYKWRRKQAERTGPAFFTSPLTEYSSLAEHPYIREADIIHLHWVADFIDYPSFFQKVTKPIVWTVHDENPGLGGFHYQTHLHQANAVYKKLDAEYAAVKKKALNYGNRPHLVAISSMMKLFFEKNEILKDCPITLIHNGVEGELYKMLDRKKSRTELGLPVNDKVFLYSSFKIEDKRKGLNLLIKALEKLNDDSVHLVCLGGYDDVPQATFRITCAGLVQNKELLSKYYSAADYFVLSSFQEAFAQTPLEAMSCGTPVISFPCSGAADLINEQNGVLCDDFTVDSLENGIREAMKTYYDRRVIRKDVLDRFSYDKIAQQYIELYQSLLDG